MLVRNELRSSATSEIGSNGEVDVREGGVGFGDCDDDGDEDEGCFDDGPALDPAVVGENGGGGDGVTKPSCTAETAAAQADCRRCCCCPRPATAAGHGKAARPRADRCARRKHVVTADRECCDSVEAIAKRRGSEREVAALLRLDESLCQLQSPLVLRISFAPPGSSHAPHRTSAWSNHLRAPCQGTST